MAEETGDQGEREAGGAGVLGLDTRPNKSGAQTKRNAINDALAKGRAVIERDRCNQCHTIEGRRGVLTAEQAEKTMGFDNVPATFYVDTSGVVRYQLNGSDSHGDSVCRVAWYIDQVQPLTQ